jgi:Tol biopolymer transport system component
MRVVDSNGSIVAEFSCSPNCTYQVARWSTDGSKLALEASAVDNSSPYSFLYTVNADGSSPVRIATSPAWCVYSGGACVILRHPFDPDWSADGRLVYTLNDTSVIVTAADGSGQRVLLSSSDGVREARWGPADRTINFVSRTSGLLHSLQAADGSGVRTLGSIVVGRYGWSPDGLSIAVESYDADGLPSLFLVHPVTGQATELVHHSLQSFAWSPNGNEIAFSDSDSLFVVNRNGALTRVSQGGIQTPWWSPDGRYLLVGTYPPAVLAISRNTGVAHEVFGGGYIRRFSVKGTTSSNGYEFY